MSFAVQHCGAEGAHYGRSLCSKLEAKLIAGHIRGCGGEDCAVDVQASILAGAVAYGAPATVVENLEPPKLRSAVLRKTAVPEPQISVFCRILRLLDNPPKTCVRWNRGGAGIGNGLSTHILNRHTSGTWS